MDLNYVNKIAKATISYYDENGKVYSYFIIPIFMIIVTWIINALAILLTAYLLPGITVSGFTGALIVSLVLGIINTILKPLLIILTLPINILTLGLFTFVINALLVLLAGSIVPGFTVNGFWWALLFSLVLSVINALLLGLVSA